ncbi:hypothetical protein LLS1_03300 [Leifsonia sp. LS1]|uniref:GDSL-type esterase/lipase family protein n=1 Tax=Leifsonia sp. LS1 TaxID=2828483 RepID=UPI001CFE4E99|nr:GDSL-type esterase/lipase family protein [Leifsonia sp. LS1]GIT78661.1 hypothetical protein LLS1_03300 [Leifsonia sp. LS1]
MNAESLRPGLRLATRARLLQVVNIRTRLVRPSDAPQGFVAGRRNIRVLLVGSGPVVGWGVGSHDLALPGAVARALASSTGRGAVVDVVAHPSAGVRRLRSLVRAATPERYDAVVLSAALADSLRLPDPGRWGERMRAVLREVLAARGGAAAVAWLGAQPILASATDDVGPARIAEEHGERLNRVAERVCREEGAHFVALAAPPHAESARPHGPAAYLFWARSIADALTPVLGSLPAEQPPSPQSAAERVEAIDRLRLAERGRDARLDGLVGTAQRTLGTEIAMFTILDDEKEWPISAVGTTPREIPIEQSACLHTIASSDGMVVTDAVDDERFAASPLVTGPAGLRYYAGYPVEAPDGTRIGALCVFSRTPRDAETGEFDLDVLRELALLAQRELWRWQPDAV